VARLVVPFLAALASIADDVMGVIERHLVPN
jgi:hypothetical protein